MNKQIRVRSANHILNLNRKQSAKHPELSNPFYDVDDNGNKVQVLCDNYRLAVLKDFVEINEILTVKTINQKFPDWKKYCDVNAIKQSGKSVELPDLKKLKEYVKALRKVDLRIPYDFGENQPCINPSYLIDAMEIVDLKTAKAYSAGYKNTCLLLIDAAGNYVYTMGINKNGTREKTDLSIRYEEKLVKVH